MRRLAALLALLAAGCGDETIVRLTVRNGAATTTPAQLRLTLVGHGVIAAPRTIAPVTLPGTVVIRRLPSAAAQLCIFVEALDGGGAVVGEGAATMTLVAHGTTRADVTLGASAPSCVTLAGDMAGAPPVDMAGPPRDLAQPIRDMANAPPSDMVVAICPAGSIFCDDFESGNLFPQWTSSSAKFDAGVVDVQSSVKAHGNYALHALGNGSSGAAVYADVEKDFTPTAPPIAVRANVYFPATLGNYDLVLALYESNTSTNAFAIGGDNAGTWVVTENESAAPDHHTSTMTTAGQWHCVELVIDAGGNVSFYVDSQLLAGPWPRVSLVSYSQLLVGVVRSIDANWVAYIDDVAVGTSRLYCPP